MRAQLLLVSQQQLNSNIWALRLQQYLWPAAVVVSLQQAWQQQQHLCPAGPSSCHQRRLASTAAATSQEPGKRAASSIKYPTKHEKRVAMFKFSQERAAWRRQVKALRMQWLAEIKAQGAAHRAGVEQVKQQIAQLRELRSADKQHDREKHQLDRLLMEAERAVDTAERRLQSARREAMRQETLQQYRQLWREDLEANSSSWIAQKDLPARIAAALDNPQTL